MIRSHPSSLNKRRGSCEHDNQVLMNFHQFGPKDRMQSVRPCSRRERPVWSRHARCAGLYSSNANDLLQIESNSLRKVVPPLIADDPLTSHFISIVSIVMGMAECPKVHLRIGPTFLLRKIRCESRRKRAIAMLWVGRTSISHDRAVVCPNGDFPLWFRSCDVRNLAIEPF